MCGLAGWAAHPESPVARRARIELLDRLLVLNEKRGNHATGVAACGGTDEPMIFKAAVDAQRFVASEPYRVAKAAWKRMARTAMVGHTRWATHNNRTLDEAAHPFQVGSVVGAHNGVIYNWREVEKQLALPPSWIVDSQAAFGALDHHEDIPEALGMLTGYAALTWWKRGRLHLTRANGASLYAAYSAQARMLVWSSEATHLRQGLSGEAMGRFKWEVWEPKEHVVYAYDPLLFAEKTGVEKTEYKWTGASTEEDRRRTSGGYSTRRTWPGHYGTSYWDAVEAKEKFVASDQSGTKTTALAVSENGKAKGKGKTKTPSQVQAELFVEGSGEQVADGITSLRAAAVMISSLVLTVRELQAKLEVLTAENAHVMSTLADYGFFDGDAPNPPEVEDVGLTNEEESPYAERCSACGETGDPTDARDPMVVLPDRTWQHERCIFAEAMR